MVVLTLVLVAQVVLEGAKPIPSTKAALLLLILLVLVVVVSEGSEELAKNDGW